MMRNDSNSVISSLQMDYGDSDEEEGEKRNTSRNNSVEEQVTVTSEPVNSEFENMKSSGEAEQDSYKTGFENEEATLNADNDEIDDHDESEDRPDVQISDDEDGGHLHHHQSHQNDSQSDKDALRKQAMAEAVSTDSPSSQGSVNPGRKGENFVRMHNNDQMV